MRLTFKSNKIGKKEGTFNIEYRFCFRSILIQSAKNNDNWPVHFEERRRQHN